MADEQDVFDRSMGDLGRYQIWLAALIMLTKFPVGWHLLNIIIIGPKPTAKCLTEGVDDACSANCTQMQIDPSPFDHTIQSQWDMVCDKKIYADLAQMLLMLGVLLGVFLFGLWADHGGRKWPLVVGSIIQAVVGTAIAFVPWLWMFLVLRFVIGFVTGGVMTTSFVLLLELIGKKWRIVVGTLYHLPNWLGHLSLAPIGYYFRNWQDSQLVVGVPSFFFISFIWLLPESPRYLVSAGKTDKAIAVMELIARRNKLPTEGIAGAVQGYAAAQADKAAPGGGQLVDLFRPRPICLRTLVLAINWLAVGLCFYGVAQYASQAAGDVFVNIAISASMEIPGTVLAVILVNTIGRKWTLLGSAMVSGAGMLVIPFLEEGSVVTPIMALIAMFGLAAMFPTAYVYSGELYPTFTRSLGVGFSSSMSRVGTVSAPFVVSLKDYNMPFWVPAVIFGFMPIISGLFVLYLPETKKTQLPNTLEEALALGKKEIT